MVGTGFNKKIVDSLFDFLDACYEGLLDKINLGTNSEKAIQTEFIEIREYLDLINPQSIPATL